MPNFRALLVIRTDETGGCNLAMYLPVIIKEIMDRRTDDTCFSLAEHGASGTIDHDDLVLLIAHQRSGKAVIEDGGKSGGTGFKCTDCTC